MQKGGFRTRTEAVKARENVITQLHERKYIPFEYTAMEFFDYWLYYYMIDEKKISYNTFMGYRNILYNYVLQIWGDKKMTAIQRDDLIDAFNAIPHKSILKNAYGVMGSAFQYAEQKGIIYLNPVKAAVKAKKKAERKKEQKEKTKKNGRVKQSIRCVYSLQQVSVMLYVCKEDEPQIFIAHYYWH